MIIATTFVPKFTIIPTFPREIFFDQGSRKERINSALGDELIEIKVLSCSVLS
jgi:hypothetical protein